jgi:putative tryptophan/tyrosine transport system substrate-binding protein
MLPKLRRVGVLADPSSAGQLPVLRRAAGVLGAELVVHQFGAPPYDLAAAYEKLGRAKVEALVPGASGHFAVQRREHVELALKHRFPAIYPNVVWVEVGGLMSYGSNFSVSFARVAEQMAQILGGAKPAEMPIEQPNAVEMVINLATAKALGIAVPQALRLRSDRVIE